MVEYVCLLQTVIGVEQCMRTVSHVYENRGQRGEESGEMTMLSIPSFKVLVEGCLNMLYHNWQYDILKNSDCV